MTAKKNNSFLSDYEKNEIEGLAEFIALNYFQKGAINLEFIAKNENITFSYGSYDDSFDGLLEHEFGRFHIYINTDRLGHAYTERARFTFAHELGHYFIDNHRNALSKGLINSHPSFTGFVSDLKMEREADYFASCLLLPKLWVKQDCFKRRFNFKLIQELSKKYQTSLTATAIRFSNIGCHPIMVICSKNKMIKWYWFTNDFPFWTLKHGKDKVPKDTAAGEFFEKGMKYKTTEIVYADDWFKVKFEDDYERQFYEHNIYGFDNTVISIIWED